MRLQTLPQDYISGNIPETLTLRNEASWGNVFFANTRRKKVMFILSKFFY